MPSKSAAVNSAVASTAPAPLSKSLNELWKPVKGNMYLGEPEKDAQSQSLYYTVEVSTGGVLFRSGDPTRVPLVWPGYNGTRRVVCTDEVVSNLTETWAVYALKRDRLGTLHATLHPTAAEKLKGALAGHRRTR